MGKISVIDKNQKIILEEVSNNTFLTSTFYFTGGTALSEVYYQHRESIDLDFFTVKKFEPQVVLEILQNLGQKFNFKIQTRFIDPVNIYLLEFKDLTKLKLDFCYYPYDQLEKLVVYKNSLTVDSKFDIGVNKLLTLTQRYEVKDFVDLYFLLQDFSFWDLKEGVKMKFKIDIDPYLIATDVLAVEDFEFLPRMIKPLDLDQLKDYYRQFSKGLAKESLK